MNDLVSICIPTYNGEKYIKNALDSVFNQTYKNLEIIISDDGSTDETIKLIEECSFKSSLPISFYQHKRKSIGANWNYCLKKAKGKYIKFLFQDDILYPECISKMMEIISKDNKISLVFSRRDIILDDNIKKQEGINEWVSKYGILHSSWENGINTIQEGRDLLKDSGLLNSPLNKVGEPTCVMLRKSMVSKAGGFNKSLKQVLDHEAWYRFFKYCKVGFINEPLCAFRVHLNQETRVNERNNIQEGKEYRYLLKRNLYRYLHPDIQFLLRSEFKSSQHNSLFYFKKKVKSIFIKLFHVYL